MTQSPLPNAPPPPKSPPPSTRTLLALLGVDGGLLFFARGARMGSYGALTIALLPYLKSIALDSAQVGALLSAIVVGDLLITLWLTTRADTFGRRRTLVIGALLKLLSGVVFASTTSFAALVVAGTLGVISVAGGEIGPFLAVEQAALADLITCAPPTRSAGAGTSTAAAAAVDVVACLAYVFSWQNALGYVALALGALGGGALVSARLAAGASETDALRSILWLYAVLGGVKAVTYCCLSRRVEAAAQPPRVGGSSTAGVDVMEADVLDDSAVDSVEAGYDDSTPLAPLADGTVAALGSAALYSSAAATRSPASVTKPPRTAHGPSLDSAAATTVAPKPQPSHAASPPASTATAMAPGAPAAPAVWWHFGLHSAASRATVARLCALFGLDAFAGGFVMQTALALWFYARWGLDATALGAMLSAANIVAGVSSMAAGAFVARFGAVNTMVRGEVWPLLR